MTPDQEIEYLRRLLFDVLPYFRDYLQTHPNVPRALLREIEAAVGMLPVPTESKEPK